MLLMLTRHAADALDARSLRLPPLLPLAACHAAAGALDVYVTRHAADADAAIVFAAFAIDFHAFRLL